MITGTTYSKGVWYVLLLGVQDMRRALDTAADLDLPLVSMSGGWSFSERSRRRARANAKPLRMQRARRSRIAVRF